MISWMKQLRCAVLLALIFFWAVLGGCASSISISELGVKRYRCTVGEARDAALRSLAKYPCTVEETETDEPYHIIYANKQEGRWRSVTVTVHQRDDGLVEVRIEASSNSDNILVVLGRMISDDLGFTMGGSLP